MKRFVSIAVIAAVLAPAPAYAGKLVTLRGGGSGHGIGMSQYGAYGMAKNGRTSTEIVKHYYRGTNVGTKSDIPGRVRVGLLQYQSVIDVKSSKLASGGTVKWKVAGTSDWIASGGTSVTWTIKPSGTGGMQLYKNGTRVKHDGKSVFGDPTHPLVLVYERFDSMVVVLDTGGRYAYGTMEFGTYKTSSCSAGYCVRLVASIPMQKYLYGLGEMPSSWPSAALQVQAMAGRIYAYRRIKTSGQHRIGCDCALYDSPVDQAYIGDFKRDADSDGNPDTYWPNWKGAVDDTNGKLILYNGSPIQALYSSSSGGHTEDNENVWGGTPLPYLRGVSDPADAVSINPNHRWNVSMKWSTLSSKLDAYYRTGKLKGFKIVAPTGVSGRVTVVNSDGTGGAKIVGSNRTVRVSGWSVRSALGLKDTLFTIVLHYTIGWRFKPKWDKLNGAPGLALSQPYYVPKSSDVRLGQAQNFEVGRMTWRKATDKVVWQWGPILRKYDRMGREKSRLGMPTSDVRGPGSYRGASYVNGRIFWRSSTGARAIWGAFFKAWSRLGGVTGSLGLPTTDRHSDSAKLPDGGTRQRFDEGTLYRNPHAKKVFGLWGDIDDKYAAIGEGSSKCGYPIADMTVTTAGASAEFEHGTITSTSLGVKVSCG